MKQKIKNKKGVWLGEETGKTILAVISIIILLFIVYNLYKILVPSKEESQATSIINNIEAKIRSLNEALSSDKMVLAGSEGWYLFSENEGKRVCVCKLKKKECDKSKKICRDIFKADENKVIRLNNKIPITLTEISFKYKKQDSNEIIEITKI